MICDDLHAACPSKMRASIVNAATIGHALHERHIGGWFRRYSSRERSAQINVIPMPKLIQALCNQSESLLRNVP